MIVDKYKGENEMLSIVAPEGQKILVAYFTIANLSSQELKFISSEYNTTYILKTETDTLKPKLTLLDNDLMMLNKSIAPGKDTSGILIFFFRDSSQELSIEVSNRDVSPDKIYNIKIK